MIGYYDKNINNNNNNNSTSKAKTQTSEKTQTSSQSTNKNKKFQVLSPGLQRLISHSENSSDEPDLIRNTSSLYPSRPPRKIGATSTPNKLKNHTTNIPLSKGACKLSKIVSELSNSNETLINDNANDSDDEVRTPTNANSSFLFRSTSIKSNYSTSSNNSSTPDINDNSFLNQQNSIEITIDENESIDNDANYRNIIKRLESISSTSSGDSSIQLRDKMSCVSNNKSSDTDSDDDYQKPHHRGSNFYVPLSKPDNQKKHSKSMRSLKSSSLEKLSKNDKLSKSYEKLTKSPSLAKKILGKSYSESIKNSPPPSPPKSSPPSSPIIGDRSTVIFKGTPQPQTSDNDDDSNTMNNKKSSDLSYSKQKALGTSPKSSRRNSKDQIQPQTNDSSSNRSLNNPPSSPLMSTLKLPLKIRPLSAASISSTSSSSSSGSENSTGKNGVSYLASVESLADHSENELVSNTFTMVERAAMEIIDSERSYVADLGQIINGYLNDWREKQSLPEDDLKIIFSNIEEVYEFNKILLKQLVNCGLDPDKIARCFIDLKDQFNVYTEYW